MKALRILFFLWIASTLAFRHTKILLQKKTSFLQNGSSVYFPEKEGEYPFHKNKMIAYLGLRLFQSNTRNMPEPLYIILWKDCSDCRELLQHLANAQKNYYYLNLEQSGLYLQEEVETSPKEKSVQWVLQQLIQLKNEIPIPMFFKNEHYLGNTLFDIYSDLFPI